LAHKVPVTTSNSHAPLILRPICLPWYYYHQICSAECNSLNFLLYSSLHRPYSSSSCTEQCSSEVSRFFPQHETTSLDVF
jgi:hypothetical protein